MLFKSSLMCSRSSVTSSLDTREMSSTTLCCMARHVLFSSWKTTCASALLNYYGTFSPDEYRKDIIMYIQTYKINRITDMQYMRCLYCFTLLWWCLDSKYLDFYYGLLLQWWVLRTWNILVRRKENGMLHAGLEPIQPTWAPQLNMSEKLC